MSQTRRTTALEARLVARALGGTVTGPNRVSAPGPGHSRRDQSLSILIDPLAPGGFLVNSFAGDDPVVCKDYVRQRLGHGSWQPIFLNRRLPHIPNPQRAIDDNTSTKWRHLWPKSIPIAGTPADAYLRVCRGILGPISATLRFLPASEKHPPAMIAAFAMAAETEPGIISVSRREIRAVHLTKLKPDGPGKADVACPKIILGRGAAGIPIIVAPPNDLLGLAITEGIEDALSVHAATGLGAWAAGSASRMPALADAVPDYIECVTIVGDDDTAGRRCAPQLAERLMARGIAVSLKFLRAPRVTSS